MIILLLSGKRFCGKDTVAAALQTLLPAVKIKTFASAYECKRLYCEKFSLDVNRFAEREYKEQHRASLTDFFHNCNIDFEAIVAQQISAASSLEIAIVTDWRFERQFAAVQTLLPHVACVRMRVNACDSARKRRGWVQSGKIDQDATETSLDTAEFDIVLQNDFTSVEQLFLALSAHVVPTLLTLLRKKSRKNNSNNSNGNSNNGYDSLAPLYEANVKRKQTTQREILDLVLDEEQGKEILILDVGCGAGIIAETFASSSSLYRVVAIDSSLEMTRLAKKRKNCTAICCDWLLYRGGGGEQDAPSYEVCFAQAYLHLFEPDEAVVHLRKMLCATRSRCFVTTTLETAYSAGFEKKNGTEVERFRVRHTRDSWLQLMRATLDGDAFLKQRFSLLIGELLDCDGRRWLNALFFDKATVPKRFLQHCYEEASFVHIYNFCDVSCLHSVSKQIRDAPARTPKFASLLRYEVASGFDRAENLVSLPGFQQLVVSLLRVCSAATKRDSLQYFKDKLNYKRPGREPFPPHQDASAGWQKLALFQCTAALALDACNAQSGALQVVAQPAAQQTLLDGPNPLDLDGFHKKMAEKWTWTTVLMEPGDLILFSGLTVHRSGSNLSDQERKLWLVTFVDEIVDRDAVENFAQQKRLRQPTMDDGVTRNDPRDAFGKVLRNNE